MKIKKSFGRRFATFLTVILTVSMLLLAAIYIGGTQFAPEGSAISLENPPEGSVSVGGDFIKNTAIYEKGLLPVSYAAIVYGGKGGGAHGSESAAKALFEFAAEPIHYCLESGAKFNEINKDAFISATFGDYLYLDFLSALPYQMLYALTGENTAAARNDDAINVDRAILAFPTGDTAKLFFSDGHRFFISTASAKVHHSELSALAGDSVLSPFSVKEFGVPVTKEPIMLPQLSISAEASFTDEEKAALYSLLGYTYSAQTSADTAVAPHGTLRMTPTRLVFTASQDGGIPVSDFLANDKNHLDVNIYDVLLGSVSLCESLSEASQKIISGADLFLDSFYRDEDIYTIIFGASSDSVRIYGTAFPYFAKISVQGGRFRSIEIRFLTVGKESFSYPLFSSAWQHSHAAEGSKVYTLRPIYRVPLLPVKEVAPAWFFTGEQTGGEPS